MSLSAMLKNCVNCKHISDGEPGWHVCERPNIPAGKNWNLLVHVQRNSTNEGMCGGKYWTPREAA